MRLVRVGLGSIDTTVGAFRENTDRALALAHDMAADGVTVGVFPEQAIGGYPVEDLIQWQGFVERQWPELERFARETAEPGDGVRHRRLRAPRRSALQLRGDDRRRVDTIADSEREAPHLQRLL